MTETPYALALAAGLVAALNPCGFALLPAYLGMVVAADDEGSSLARALRMTAAMSVGFVAIFGAFGAVVVPLTLSLERYLPWATIVIGIGLVVGGGWLLAGREMRVPLPRLRGAAPAGSTASMVGYGAAYAIASLSCTVGPFLAILATTTRSGGIAEGLAVVAVYGLGMGLVVGVLAVAVALARDAVVTRTRRLLPYVNRLSGLLLVLAGSYVTYYGWYELRVFDGANPTDPVVDAARSVQGRLAQLVGDTGATTLLAVLVCLVLAAVVVAGATRRSLPRR
ncbi:MAG: cytochrome c biogenesis protein CcdA [Actinomycetota bacterium]|nr:cytochrome c biogenesis protein CcdA [Actinomycetota bacterium]